MYSFWEQRTKSKKMKYCSDFTIVENKALNPTFFRLKLQSKDKLAPVKAGQFVEIQTIQPSSVLLRRPISIHDVDEESNSLYLLIQKVGKGSNELSNLEENQTVNLIYPCGNGFDIKGNDVLLVGGGVGIAPLLYLSKCFYKQGIKPTMLMGFRTKEQMIPIDEFESFCNVYISTQDGSFGQKGLVTENTVMNHVYDTVYTCGPSPMMQSIACFFEQKGIPCFVSLENKMACGIGACLCCAQNTHEGYKCTCTDGPVFDSKEIIW